MGTKNAATEAQLGELHSKVAKVMKRALDVADIAMERYEADESGELIQPEVSATLLGAITKFLKDNSISAAPEDSNELSDLQRTLAEKRQRRQLRVVGGVSHTDPED